MENLLILFIVAQVGVIILLLLIELDIFYKIYLHIYTHPKINKVTYLLGDALYMIGGSVVGAGIYEIITRNELNISVLFYGIIIIIIGIKLKKGK